MTRALKVLYEIRDGLEKYCGGVRGNRLYNEINGMIDHYEYLLWLHKASTRYH